MPSRKLFLGSALAVALLPPLALADDAKRYRVKARLWRVSDLKEARVLTAICPVGKTVTAIDGERDFHFNPPKVNGLRATFNLKPDGDTMIAVHCEAVFRDTKANISARVGEESSVEERGQLFIEASSNYDFTVAPGDHFDVPYDVYGVRYTFTFIVENMA